MYAASAERERLALKQEAHRAIKSEQEARHNANVARDAHHHRADEAEKRAASASQSLSHSRAQSEERHRAMAQRMMDLEAKLAEATSRLSLGGVATMETPSGTDRDGKLGDCSAIPFQSSPAATPYGEARAERKVGNDHFCQECGEKLKPHQKFCSECGRASGAPRLDPERHLAEPPPARGFDGHKEEEKRVQFGTVEEFFKSQVFADLRSTTEAGGSDPTAEDSSSSSDSDDDGEEAKERRSLRKKATNEGGLLDIFGQAAAPPPDDDMTWTVAEESEVYRRRDIDRVKIYPLPRTATAKRSWDVSNTANLAAIDCTSDDTLTRWILLALDAQGSVHDILSRFHQNSQGLNMLDRHLASLMLTPENLRHPIFGTQFAGYQEWCQHQRQSAKGRVLLAMVSIRFRLDRSRGKHINLIHLLKIELESYKLQHVQEFVEKVRRALSSIPTSEIKDNQLMYTWLYEKFKSWKEISTKIDKIKESKPNSPSDHGISFGVSSPVT